MRQGNKAGQGNRQGKETGQKAEEIGRAWKQAGQGKEKVRQPARQGNKVVGENDRWIILILCINFASMK